MSDLVYNDDEQRLLVEKLAKVISKELKEEIWFNFSFRFKKRKNGQILIANIDQIKKSFDKQKSAI